MATSASSLQGGYDLLDVHFVGPENKRRYYQYLCSKCSLLLKDAVRLNCGDCLCKSCADDIFANAQRQFDVMEASGSTMNHPRCPNNKCGQVLQLVNGVQYTEDPLVRSEVLNLIIKCPIQRCRWVDRLGRYEAHKKSHHAPYSATVEPSEPRNATHFVVDIEASAVRIDNPTHLQRQIREIKRAEKEITQEQNELQQKENEVRLKEDEVRLKEDEHRVELRRKKDEIRAKQDVLGRKKEELRKRRQGVVFDVEDYANGIECYLESLRPVRITAPMQNETETNARTTSSLGRAAALTPNEKSSTLNADGPEEMARFEQEAELEYAPMVEDDENYSSHATNSMLVAGVGYEVMSWDPDEAQLTPAYQESQSTWHAMDYPQLSLNTSLRRRPPNYDQMQAATSLPPTHAGASASIQLHPTLVAYDTRHGFSQTHPTCTCAAAFHDRPPQQILPTLPPIQQVPASNHMIRYPTPTVGAAAMNNGVPDSLRAAGVQHVCLKCKVLKDVIVCMCETFSEFRSNPSTFPRIIAPSTMSSCRQRGHSWPVDQLKLTCK